MSEPHFIVTEYDDNGFHWWCSCGYDTDNRYQLHQHIGM